MSSFQGSISNFPPLKRMVIILLSLVLPISALGGTIILSFYVDWWQFILALDIIAIVVAFSLSGLFLKGHHLIFKEDEMSFNKGWSKGRIPYRNIIRVYRVVSRGKDGVHIVFNEPSSKNNPNRCLSVDQVFSERDRESIFKRLKRNHDKFSYTIVDMASNDHIRNDRNNLKWVPV